MCACTHTYPHRQKQMDVHIHTKIPVGMKNIHICKFIKHMQLCTQLPISNHVSFYAQKQNDISANTSAHHTHTDKNAHIKCMQMHTCTYKCTNENTKSNIYTHTIKCIHIHNQMYIHTQSNVYAHIIKCIHTQLNV